MIVKNFWDTFKNNYLPIHKNEFRKIIFICILKGLISSIYSVLTNLKDAVIVGAKGSGAEALSVVRGFLVLPFSFILIYIYSKLSNKFKPTSVFYSIMGFFVVSFIVYGFILRPYEPFFAPINSAKILLNYFGETNKHWVAVYKNWIHAFFYILCELWCQASIMILFWEFVNRICTIELAKRSYNLFIAAGALFNFITAFLLYSLMKFLKASFSMKFKIITIYICLCIVVLIIVYYYLNKNHEIINFSKKKTKLPFIKGLKFILSSKYLLCMTIVVIALGISSNLVSVTWKANLKLLFTKKSNYVSFMTKINGLENLFSFLIVFFISGKTIRKKGWLTCALITPITILITGCLFFLSSKFKVFLNPIVCCLNFSPLYFVVILGGIQVISTKVSRYCFHDISREIAYIPLDNESKVKGKAAIDTIGNKFGKSASSYIHLLILWMANTGSVLDITMFLIPVLIIVCGAWILSVFYIDNTLKKFE